MDMTNIVTVLIEVANAPLSGENLKKLGGQVAATIPTCGPDAAFGYLSAAAKQLPVVCAPPEFASSVMVKSNEPPFNALTIDVLKAVGSCVARCAQPEKIVQSGIIQVLCLLQKEKKEVTIAHNEFLQACIYAKEYAFAYAEVHDVWPRPRKGVTSSQNLLRYYYLRGVVYLGTQNWTWAGRCFKTCLCVPSQSSNVVSAIAIAAWKKMVLVQCLQNDLYVPQDLSMPEQSSEFAQGLIQYIHDASKTNTWSKVVPESTSPAVVEEPVTDQDAPRAPSFPFYGVSHYKDLVSAFAKIDRKAFDKVTNDAAQLFIDDGTSGLVDRVGRILLRRQVYQIGSIFSTISVDQFASELGVPDSLSLLQRLSVEKSWPVQIEDGWIAFPALMPSLQPPLVMEATRRDLALLSSRLQTLHSEVASSPQQASRKKDESSREHNVPPCGVEDV